MAGIVIVLLFFSTKEIKERTSYLKYDIFMYKTQTRIKKKQFKTENMFFPHHTLTHKVDFNSATRNLLQFYEYTYKIA